VAVAAVAGVREAVAVVAAATAVAVAAKAKPVAAPTAEQLAERASQIGAAWVHEFVTELRAQERPPTGAWPGTISEARRRVRARVEMMLDAQQLDELARVANYAARRSWKEVCEPDPET
jgi:hypothetical protein